MTEHEDLDLAGAHRLNRRMTIVLVGGALAIAIPAALTTLNGPIATTLCALASAAVLWVVARSLRHPG